jgi:hypothetical protein
LRRYIQGPTDSDGSTPITGKTLFKLFAEHENLNLNPGKRLSIIGATGRAVQVDGFKTRVESA